MIFLHFEIMAIKFWVVLISGFQNTTLYHITLIPTKPSSNFKTLHKALPVCRPWPSASTVRCNMYTWWLLNLLNQNPAMSLNRTAIHWGNRAVRLKVDKHWSYSFVTDGLTHLGDQLQHDLDALDDAVWLASDQNHTVSGVRAALLEQFDGGLRILEADGKEKGLSAAPPPTRGSDVCKVTCTPVSLAYANEWHAPLRLRDHHGAPEDIVSSD